MNKLVLCLACFIVLTLNSLAAVTASDMSNQAPPASASGAAGSDKPADGRVEFENALIKMFIIPRTREQMKAFYEGRGFPKTAIAGIAEACFMTVVIYNKTGDVLWLELENWSFDSESSSAADVARLGRSYWLQRWEELSVPMANRSTFGWTLLPETRDLRADESVGGNITMRYSEQPFTITAQFFRGEDKKQGPLSVQLKHLQCVK